MTVHRSYAGSANVLRDGRTSVVVVLACDRTVDGRDEFTDVDQHVTCGACKVASTEPKYTVCVAIEGRVVSQR